MFHMGRTRTAMILFSCLLVGASLSSGATFAVAADEPSIDECHYRLTVVAKGNQATKLRVYLDAPRLTNGTWPVPQHVPLVILDPLGPEGHATQILPLKEICPGPHSIDVYVEGRLRSLECVLDVKRGNTTRQIRKIEREDAPGKRHYASASFFNGEAESNTRDVTIFYQCRLPDPKRGNVVERTRPPKNELATCFPERGIETVHLWDSPKGQKCYLELRYDHCYRARILEPGVLRRRGRSLPPSQAPWRLWGKSKVMLEDDTRMVAYRVSHRLRAPSPPSKEEEERTERESLRKGLRQTFGAGEDGRLEPARRTNGGSAASF